CGASDGSITVTATGGSSGAYEYSTDGMTWIGFTAGASTTLSGLGRGGFYVFVRENGGDPATCMDTIAVCLIAPYCCDFIEGSPITFMPDPSSMPPMGISQEYILTAADGEILEIATSSAFTSMPTAGTYIIYTINY